MISFESTRSNPNNYRIINTNSNKSISVLYDVKNAQDEEMLYTFNPDGSATLKSLAWGKMTSCPEGTFSDILLKIPPADELNSQHAQWLAQEYNKYVKKNNIIPRNIILNV